MVKIKIRINTIEGKNLAELESEFDKDEERCYASEEMDALKCITGLVSTMKEFCRGSYFVAGVDPAIEGSDHTETYRFVRQSPQDPQS